jgi:hypothetical protein
MNPDNQSELFTAYRYHAVFTDSPLPMLEAEKAHRAHAIVEQVIADLKNGPLAHLPSVIWANSAWLVCATMAFNLTRATGTLAAAFHARATTGTIRAHLITIPARLARSARRLTLHLPTDWPWEQAWKRLLTARLHDPPLTALTHPSSDRTRPQTAWRPAGSPGLLAVPPSGSRTITPRSPPTTSWTVDPGLAAIPIT